MAGTGSTKLPGDTAPRTHAPPQRVDPDAPERTNPTGSVENTLGRRYCTQADDGRKSPAKPRMGPGGPTRPAATGLLEQDGVLEKTAKNLAAGLRHVLMVLSVFATLKKRR